MFFCFRFGPPQIQISPFRSYISLSTPPDKDTAQVLSLVPRLSYSKELSADDRLAIVAAFGEQRTRAGTENNGARICTLDHAFCHANHKAGVSMLVLVFISFLVLFPLDLGFLFFLPYCHSQSFIAFFLSCFAPSFACWLDAARKYTYMLYNSLVQ